MGNSISQGITSTQFYLHGRKNFTRTGYEEAKKSFKPGALEQVDLKDKVYLVTGANSGLGAELTEYLASKGGRVYMVCRNKERAEVAKKAIVEKTKNEQVEVIIGDCGLKEDVQSVVEQFGSKEKKLDCLVCNAGTITDDKVLTKEGVETTFATHLLHGAYTLSTLATPYLEAAEEPRVVMVSSGGMYNSKFPKWSVSTATSETYKYDGQLAYCYAKRGQVLLCEEWAKQNKKIAFASCHPGWVDTPGVSAVYGDKKSYLEPLRSLWEGTDGIAWLCVAPKEELKSGEYYLDRTPQRKHLSGPFFTDGSFTKNTPQEVETMMTNLSKWSKEGPSSTA
ncbi:hypothetical protein CYMTET_3113 [Cymbomonas tetramitiformis]|uniref:Dehydrogenase/reductase SDR family member 12 n=1 Tax=Cymbomonas tetramitiformis TaxID=36881 RepID=A0AAE0H3W0_9CHLO|nr:hypothetical protein CYMTET_3113 [Cymbomonas tetramitiformis]